MSSGSFEGYCIYVSTNVCMYVCMYVWMDGHGFRVWGFGGPGVIVRVWGSQCVGIRCLGSLNPKPQTLDPKP